MKVKGYVLLVTLIVMLIFTLISYYLLFYAYYHRAKMSDLVLDERLRNNFNSAVNLSFTPSILNDVQYEIDLFDSGLDSVFIQKSSWGLYNKCIIQSKNKNKIKQAVFFIGYLWPVNNALLYIEDRGKIIYTSGNVLVNGDAFLPSKGLKSTFIDNLKKPLNVKIKKTFYSNAKLFSLPSNLLNLNYLSTNIRNEQLIDHYENIDTLSNSFYNNYKVIYSPGRLNLYNRVITGNIKIISNREIVVDSTCMIQDAILISPRIIIRKGFKGSLQCFSSELIQLEQNVSLEYPSSIFVSGRQCKIILGENTKIRGGIIASSNSELIGAEVYLPYKLDYNGFIYVDGKLEIHGDFKGSIYCSESILKTKSGVYEDVISDFSIQPIDSFYYTTIDLFNSKLSKNSIAKWLK